jgi:hypothetical protein
MVYDFVAIESILKKEINDLFNKILVVLLFKYFLNDFPVPVYNCYLIIEKKKKKILSDLITCINMFPILAINLLVL